MRSIDETKTLGTRLLALVGVAAIVGAAGVIWAASALAGGGSPGEPDARNSPAAENVQNEGGGSDGDCPERDGEAQPSSNV